MAFGYYKTFTADATQAGTADSTNFPITISVTDADLKTTGNGGYVQSSSGYDIRPYSDSGLTSALTFELVYYNASTGQLEMHVKVGTLSHTTNLVSYLAFGDATISTDGSSTSTWDSTYKAVYHFKDGSTLNLNDSTSAANHLSGTSSPTAVAGQIDGGVGFTGGSYATSGANIGISGSSNRTIEAWIRPTSLSGIRSVINWGAGSNSNNNTLHLNVVAGSDIYFGFQGADFYTAGSKAPTGSWTHVVVAYTGAGAAPSSSNSKIYVNGVSESLTFSGGGGVNTSATALTVGRDATTAGREFDGREDEVRISDANRFSSSYVTATYNNQKPSSTFLTWGSRTTVGGGGSTTKTLAALGVG